MYALHKPYHCCIPKKSRFYSLIRLDKSRKKQPNIDLNGYFLPQLTATEGDFGCFFYLFRLN